MPCGRRSRRSPSPHRKTGGHTRYRLEGFRRTCKSLFVCLLFVCLFVYKLLPSVVRTVGVSITQISAVFLLERERELREEETRQNLSKPTEEIQTELEMTTSNLTTLTWMMLGTTSSSLSSLTKHFSFTLHRQLRGPLRNH